MRESSSDDSTDIAPFLSASLGTTIMIPLSEREDGDSAVHCHIIHHCQAAVMWRHRCALTILRCFGKGVVRTDNKLVDSAIINQLRILQRRKEQMGLLIEDVPSSCG